MPFRLKLVVSVLFVALIAILLSLFLITCQDTDSSFEKQYHSLVDPYHFSLFGWEIRTLYNQAKQSVVKVQPDSSYNSETVLQYFSLIDQLHNLKTNIQFKNKNDDVNDTEKRLAKLEDQIATLKPIVEQIIEKQLSLTLAEQGIFNPISNNWLKAILPPVNFVLEDPPYILVISPKNKIERMRETILIQDLSSAQIEELESSLEKLNVSALVESLGGLGATYPSFVEANSLRFTINTATEEWLHQYLAFKPLGFRYILNLLGLNLDADIPTINETLASLISKELGELVYTKYYPQEQTNVNTGSSDQATLSFDFNKEMREIRLTVDNYLALGEIAQAEQFMKDKRLFLESKGYYIRKLNQAYFAFYGSYADSPTSINPIGEKLRLLRKNSSSIKDFLEIASDFSSKQDLDQAVDLCK